MAASPADRLNGVRTFDDVLEYFADVLDWPLTSTDIEDSTFDYSPSELGIPEDRAPRFGPIRELIPVTADQPWGIFFLEFSGQRLPITQLRQLLQRLVTRKRKTPGVEHRTWDLADLLFVVTTDSGSSVELHLVAFSEQEGKTAQVRSLPWRPGHSPHQHLHRVATELLPNLVWPEVVQ